jgi:hypothetical protein
MMARVLEAKTSKRCVTAAVRPVQAAVRRPILVGILLTVALLTMSAIESRPSGAATKPAATTPAVSPVTVTVPGHTTPAPAVTAPTPAPAPAPAAPPVKHVVAPPVTSTPSSSTSAAPSSQTPPVSTVSSSSTSSLASSSSSPAHSARAGGGGGRSELRLRSVVVTLSSCVSRLNPRGRRLLLLRAGIGTAGPLSRRTVARKLGVSVAREARSERAALRKLHRAARRGSCGSTPAWIHVPAADRLVLVDPALTSVSQHGVSSERAKVSLSLSTAVTGSRLGSGLEWRRLVWVPEQQS